MAIAFSLALITVHAIAAAKPADSEAVERGLRPYEAPLLGKDAKLPQRPAEYLKEDRDGIQFLYHPSARERVRTLIEVATEVRGELTRQLGGDVLQSLQIRVAVGSADFARVVPADSPDGGGVVAFTELGLLVLSLDAGPSPTGDDVVVELRRGMAFLALDEVTAGRQLPRWFRVGHALHFSEPSSMERSRALWWASMQQRLTPVVDLDWYLTDRAAYESVAAAEAADFVRYLAADERSGAFVRTLSEVKDGRSFEQALRNAYQLDQRELENDWRADVAKHKAFLPMLFGGSALWVLVAVGISIRRRLRRGDDEQRPVPVGQGKESRARAAKPAKRLKRLKRKDAKRMPTTELPEPEVPKVSHNGRWHTLH